MKNFHKITINNRKWEVRFIDASDMRDGDIGTCWSYKRTIDIDNSLDREEARIILAHELAHAFLASCGDIHQDQYGEEKVCDFVAWNIDNIITLRDKVIAEQFTKRAE